MSISLPADFSRVQYASPALIVIIKSTLCYIHYREERAEYKITRVTFLYNDSFNYRAREGWHYRR